MSAWPDEPDHFLNWLRNRDPEVQPGAFAPRQLYGDYLEELLRDAIARPGSTLTAVRGEVVDLIEEEADYLTLVTRDGIQFGADVVVLALGNQAPQDPIAVPDSVRQKRAYISNPWTDDPLGDLSTGDPVVVIGSGLTAVDLIVEAQARGTVGKMTAISRHGLLPRAHAAEHKRACAAPLPPRQSPLKIRGLLRSCRDEVKRAEAAGGDWRTVIDALRPELQGIWKSLDDAERRRFLRHLSAYWDVHRHRVAPEIDEIIQRARREGVLSVVAGRVRRLINHQEGVDVVVSRRGSTTSETVFVRRVINCTGPGKEIRAGFPPLQSALVRRGLATPDRLGLGLEVGKKGTLIGTGGRNQGRVFVLGPTRRGELWETTAVRELRQQAADLAEHVIGSLKAPSGWGVPGPHWHRSPRLISGFRPQGVR
jgi:uncharacterized NAD(P)/FAD-binding protein YdhS